ncbi:MAG TPA: hypothetical protein EYP11_05380, partial [Aquificaceae bacterium]|nr:hypothetical protein [Aquificaceae bacterium]HIQ31755.1 hypothetical protein [Aquifex aeolicus]
MKTRALLLFFSLVMGGLVSFFLLEQAPRTVSEKFNLPTRSNLMLLPGDLRWGASYIGFINVLAFAGSSLKKGYMSEEEGKKLYRSLEAITFYNPRYFDPYYVASALLTWEAGLYGEVLTLLERGLGYLKDPRIAFYTGFIYFYFLGEKEKGARYMELAAELGWEGALPILVASRLRYEEGKTELAIALLERQRKVARDDTVRRVLERRLRDLKTVLLVQRAIREFKNRFGRAPMGMEELVREGLVPPDLRDSKGGKFYITEEGEVRSERVFR